MPTELKHCSGKTAEIVLIENPGWPRFEVEAWRLDGGFLLAATDDERTAEAVYLRASLSL
jgi:hypothetical protein